MKSTFCVAEDRKSCEPCLKLLLLSLRRHIPEAPVSLFYPPASEPFIDWMQKCPQVQLQAKPLKNGYGWNVKPQAIMHLLDEGFDEVIWIDSDVIVNRDLFPVFSNLPGNTVVVTEHTLSEERFDGDALRARLWGLAPGRSLPFGLSSGVVRVTKKNYGLMERWWQLLQSEPYQQAQRTPWQQRQIHMLGDQDVLTALLTSKEFAHIPIHILRRGKHIIQFDGVYGYTLAERLRNLLGDGPSFVHSGAGKPWSEGWELDRDRFVREYIKKVYLDISPYTLSAIRFKDELGSKTDWMEPHFALSRILRSLGIGHAPLVGLPMAVFADLARLAKQIRRLSQRNGAKWGQDGRTLKSEETVRGLNGD